MNDDPHCFAHGGPPIYKRAMPFGLSDAQLESVMAIAADITPEKRTVFLERVGAMLAIRRRAHFDDGDIAEVASLASTGLVRRPAA